MIVGLVPIRSFRTGMARLGQDLDPTRRESLGRALARHVLAALSDAGYEPMVVSADSEVLAWADHSGLGGVRDPGSGLDAAAGAAVDWAGSLGRPWLLIHSDLPLLIPTDLGILADLISTGADVIAPSADGGTSAISSTRRVEFSFGIGSFHRHLPRLDNPVVVTSTGLLCDLDSPGDLKAAADHPAGTWLREV